MRHGISRAARAAAAAAALLWGSASAQAVTLQTWSTSARISSGNTTLVAAPSPPAPAGPDDTTGFLEADGDLLSPPGPIDAVTISEFGISGGTLAAGSAFAGEANAPLDNRLFHVFGGAATTYFDDLTVTSASLANGTPVDVRFVFDLAFVAGADVTAGAISEANRARSLADVQATAAGVVGIDQNTNRFVEDLESGSFLQTGIFSGTQHAEFTIATTVGSTFPFALVVDADVDGALHPNAGGVNGAAEAESFLALSFGAEVVDADAAVVSNLLGGEFPPAALVSPAAAEAALPPNPLAVPEPSGATWVLLPAVVALARSRRPGRGSSRPERWWPSPACRLLARRFLAEGS